MQDFTIYNTLTGNKEVFKSIKPESVTMYVCGPTVYGEPHLGHASQAITYDILFNDPGDPVIGIENYDTNEQVVICENNNIVVN